MKMSNPLAINLVGVGKKYGSFQAVQDIDLSLSKGECVALVGHNGAGKSTLIKMMLGLVTPTTGTVSVFKKTPSSDSFNDMRRHIGFLPEQVLFQKNMTGRETLEFYARLKRLPGQNFDDLFTRVDLIAAADRKVGTYSKGMRQKLGMAQALLGTPKLLILDEPTTGLDPMARQNMYRIMDEEKSRGATVLISSHVLTELDDRIDRVVILNRGHVAAVGTIPILCRNIGMQVKIVIRASEAVCAYIRSHISVDCQFEASQKGCLKLECPLHLKVAALADIMAMRQKLDDIELIEPTLETVFNSYSAAGPEGERHD